MGIIGSLRVSNFSLFWVTDSPFYPSLFKSVFNGLLTGSGMDGTYHLATFKIITQGKPMWREYF
jgi:hypothetical protein